MQFACGYLGKIGKTGNLFQASASIKLYRSSMTLPPKHFRSCSHGFSITELLVSIAIIVILISLIMPGIHAAKEHAKKTVCMSNLHQFAVAWTVFPSDYNQKIVNGLPDDTDGWVKRGSGYDPIRNGALYPYLNTLNIWHCPSDDNGNERSYSITATMRGEAWDRHLTQPDHSWIQVGTDQFTEIIKPSNQIVFLEELDTRGWNIGSWIMYARDDYKYRWIDYMTIFHGDGTVMSFADGHVDYWYWEDKDTLYAAKNRQFFLNDLENTDWIRIRNAYRSLPSYPNVPELVTE